MLLGTAVVAATAAGMYPDLYAAAAVMVCDGEVIRPELTEKVLMIAPTASSVHEHRWVPDTLIASGDGTS